MSAADDKGPDHAFSGVTRDCAQVLVLGRYLIDPARKYQAKLPN
jgi:hypothetical protein